MSLNLLSAIRGANGEPEIIRTTGALGVIGYVLGALFFQAWAMHKGDHFDIVAFCAAFPAGLALAYGAIAGAAALKDRNVATAKIIADTGAVPTKPPAGPAVPTAEVQQTEPDLAP
jgi:uncharacterized membrane protein YeaQ/YmgE (transglycosylase-associated protein family)